MNDFRNRLIFMGSLGAVFIFTLVFSYGPGYGGRLFAFLGNNVTSSPKMSPSDMVTPLVTQKKMVTLQNVTNVTTVSPTLSPVVYNDSQYYLMSPTVSPVPFRVTNVSPSPLVTLSVSPKSTMSPSPTANPSPVVTSILQPPATPTPTQLPTSTPVPTTINVGSVVINEIAWMGTSAPGTTGSSDEWIELYNAGNQSVDLSGWHLTSIDGSPNISLVGTISAGGYYLIERTDNQATSIVADLAVSFGTGGLKNDPGEKITLTDVSGLIKDVVDCSAGAWFAGSNDTKSSMERISPYADGNNPTNWSTNDGIVRNGQDVAGGPINGTPGVSNSVSAP